MPTGRQRQQHEESRVVPVLVAALICDVAAEDPSTKKKNLIGIFDRISVRKFPVSRMMSLYIKLTDAEGFYNISARFVERSSGNILAEVRTELGINNRLASVDMYLPSPPLLIPSKGRYEFQILANSVFLGTAFLDAVQANIAGDK